MSSLLQTLLRTRDYSLRPHLLPVRSVLPFSLSLPSFPFLFACGFLPSFLLHMLFYSATFCMLQIPPILTFRDTRFCLTRALDHGQACPLCRSIMHLASEPPVTVVLQKIIEKNFPSEYSLRKEEMLEVPHDVTWYVTLLHGDHVKIDRRCCRCINICAHCL